MKEGAIIVELGRRCGVTKNGNNSRLSVISSDERAPPQPSTYCPPRLRVRRRSRPFLRMTTTTAAMALAFVTSILRSPGTFAMVDPDASTAFASVGGNRRRPRCTYPRGRAIPISPTSPCSSSLGRGGLIMADAKRLRPNALVNSIEEIVPRRRRCGDYICTERFDRGGSFKYRRRGDGLSNFLARTMRGLTSRRRVLTAMLAAVGCCLLVGIAFPSSASAYVDAAASSVASAVTEPAAATAAATGAAAIDLASTTATTGALSSASASVSAVAAASPPRLFVHRLGNYLVSACRRTLSSLGTSIRQNAGLSARLLYASFVGGCVGLHRPKSTHVADRDGNGMGTRTFALVALGACMFTLCGTHGLTNMYGIPSSCSPPAGIMPAAPPTAAPPLGPQVKIDVSRMASNVATGVGFIGAGVITSNRRQDGTVDVRGLTTAASVWVSAAVGIAAGAGMYFAAACGMAVTVAVIRWGNILPSSHSHDVIDRRRPRQRGRRRRHQHQESSADLVAAATIPSAADLTDSGLLPPPPTSSLDYDYLPTVVPTSEESHRRVKIDPVREMEERYHRSRGRAEEKRKKNNGRADGTGSNASVGRGQQRDSSSSSSSTSSSSNDQEVEGLPMASSSTLLHDGREEELDVSLRGRLTGKGGGTGGSNRTVWDDCAP